MVAQVGRSLAVRTLRSVAAGDAAAMNSVLDNGATVRYSETATAIGDDVNTLQNFARSRGADGHDVILHGTLIDGEAHFVVDGMITHPQQIANAVLGNSTYRRGPITLVTCHGACGLAQELEEILGVRVNALPARVDLEPFTGVLRALE